MDLEIPELPFPLRTYGPDGHWAYEDGVLSGWAGPRQDRFVPPTGEARAIAIAYLRAVVAGASPLRTEEVSRRAVERLQHASDCPT